MTDPQPPPPCPNCGHSMTYEHVVRQGGPTGGGDVAPGWTHPGYYRRAHCFRCDHVVEPPTQYDEH